jgi:hypothetical protein
MTDQDKKDSRNSGKDKESKENLFLIMDGIIYQLNTTKRIFILMILTIMIIPPMSFVVTFTLFGPSFPFDGSRAL